MLGAPNLDCETWCTDVKEKLTVALGGLREISRLEECKRSTQGVARMLHYFTLTVNDFLTTD